MATASPLTGARLLDAGESALVIEFGLTVDLSVHDRVMALDAAIQAAGIDGIRETVPTYRSLMVHYDPLAIQRQQLIETLTALPAKAWRQDAARWVLPVCFDAELGDDLVLAAGQLNCSVDAIIDGLLRSRFRLYMYGFAPGLAYLGGLVPELHIPRRATPRPLMPASSIIIAGGLAAIGSVPMPTGWYVTGRTPASMFEVNRQGHVPFAAGDEITLEQIGRDEFDRLEPRGLAGEALWRAAA